MVTTAAMTLVTATALTVASGCMIAPPAPVPSTRPGPSATSAVPLPSDGWPLAAFGVQNGPGAFSLPRSSVLTRVVDQPNGVVLVLSAPAPAEVAGYLQRALPAAGFEAGPTGEAFTFTGPGWSGSFTSSAESSAILLRPS